MKRLSMRVDGTTVKRLLSCMTVFMLIVILCLAIPVHAQEATPTVVQVGIPVEEYPELFLPRSMPTHGEGKIAVFLIDFPDYRNENSAATVEYYDRLYFSGGITTSWGDVTVASFFHTQSYGKLSISGRVFDW